MCIKRSGDRNGYSQFVAGNNPAGTGAAQPGPQPSGAEFGHWLTLVQLGYQSDSSHNLYNNQTLWSFVVPKLDDLIVDETELDRDLLAGILAPYVRLSRGSGKPIFTPAFATLPASNKVLVFLLARKAAVSLELAPGPESASPKEIAESTSIPHGTVKPVVIGLVKRGLLQGKAEAYSIPSHALFTIKEVLG